MAYKSSPRGTRPVSLIAGHTAEGARTARSLAAYFWQDTTMASSHVAIDATETLPMVPRERASWTLRSGNPISVNAELCAFARWTRAQWLSTGTVDGCVNPRAMLDRFAAWIRQEATILGIPLNKLSPVQVSQGHWGVIAHVDWTLGMDDGTHWDMGTGMPWDYVMAQVSGVVPPTRKDDDMGLMFIELPPATDTANPGRKYIPLPPIKDAAYTVELCRMHVATGHGNEANYRVWAVSQAGAYVGSLDGDAFVSKSDRPAFVPIPDGTAQIAIEWTTKLELPVGLTFETRNF